MTMMSPAMEMMNEMVAAMRKRHEEAQRNAPLRVPDKAGIVPPDDGAWTARRAWLSQAPLDGSARLRVWLMEAPGAHAFWCHWIISVVHLRSMEGVQDAVKSYPEAEYELTVAALDPREPIDIDGTLALALLQPLDLVFQFHGVTDDQAAQMVDWYVDNVMSGPMSPDSDMRIHWQRRLAARLQEVQSAH